MKRNIAWLFVTVILGIFAFPRCAGCFDDPDDPKLWIKRLMKATSKDKREEALINLYRIYEFNKAYGEKDKTYLKKLVSFRDVVVPSLVKVFNKKVKGKYLRPELILTRLIGFEPQEKHKELVGGLFLEVIKKYTNDEADYGDEEDVADSITGKAVLGLADMARRQIWVDGIVSALTALIKRICKKASKGSLDRNSFVRNSVVEAMGDFLAAKKADKKQGLAAIMNILVNFGQDEKAGQDAMVTIKAMRILGDVGDTSPDSVKALVRSLLGKGRGRRYYSFASTALAKLPLGKGGKHPAVEPLILMLRGNPWTRAIEGWEDELEGKPKPSKEKKKELEKKIKDLSTLIKNRKVMPKCPYKPGLKYVCEVFWQSVVEQWDASEPGVIPMNALMTLREIGDTSAVPVMLELYGVDTVKKRWLKAAVDMANEREVCGGGEFKTKDFEDLPGLQTQRMIVPTYSIDSNIRMELLRAIGRMNAPAAKDEKVAKMAREEIIKSLSFAGDPGMFVKAGEGATLAKYDKEILEILIKKSTSVASMMMVNFKKRMIRDYFWGKIRQGGKYECSEKDKKKVEEMWKECTQGTMPKGEDDPNWHCFNKLKKMWLDEFRYQIQYNFPGEPKRLLHEHCKKNSRWYNTTFPALKKKATGSSEEAQQARRQAYACQENPPKGAKNVVKCGTWPKCNSATGYLCLDGHLQMRNSFHRHAVLLATHDHFDKLYNMTPDDIMFPYRDSRRYAKYKDKTHRFTKDSVPKKGKSPFCDPEAGRLLEWTPWDEKLEKLRNDKAKETIARHLCYHRRFLRVAQRCKTNVDCYVQVINRSTAQQLDWEDCKTNPMKVTIKGKKKATWRAVLKALRMGIYYASKSGRTSRAAKNVLRAAINLFPKLGRDVTKNVLTELREMIIMVIDRLGDLKAHTGLSCEYPYKDRIRQKLRNKLGVTNLEEKISQKKRDGKIKALDAQEIAKVKKWQAEKRKKEKLVEKEWTKLTKDRPCLKMLKMVIEDETDRRVRGVWQINRDARSALGRLARRAGKSYSDI